MTPILRRRIAAIAMVSLMLSAYGMSYAQEAQAPTYGPMKPIISGLISMGPGGYNPAVNDNAAFSGIPGNKLDDVIAKRNAFDGTVINIPWKEIEPTSGTLNSTAIDTVLSAIRRYNASKSTTVPLKAILRIWAGINAPDWVKALDGGPVTVYIGGPINVGAPYTIGHFWASGYQAAWRGLQSQLAAKYDSEPLIVEVANTSCTSADDESMALSWYFDKAKGISSVKNLHAAGFSDAAYKNCLTQSPADYSNWKTTYVNSTLGAIFLTDAVQDYQFPVRNFIFTQQLIPVWKQAFGVRTILSNHILNYPPSANGVPIYVDMKNARVPLEFQTHSPHNLKWSETVDEAVCLGGTALELWNSTGAGGYVQQSLTTLFAWSHDLKYPKNNIYCATSLVPGAQAKD